MTNERDPELLDDDNEGTGDADSYDEHLTEVRYDPSLFELPEDFEYLELDEDEEGSEDEENG